MRLARLLVAGALAAAPAAGQVTAFVGGTLHPVSGPAVANGTLLVRDGKIAALGAGLAVPPGATIVDLKGGHVYPSLFPPLTDLGLVEISSVRATVDTTEIGEINPQARPDFAMNFDSELLPVARSAGILIAGVAPSGGIVSGTLAAMKLDGWTREDATLKAPAAIIVRWPDLTIDRSPTARQSVRLQEKRRDEALQKLKDAFAEARAYADARAAEGKAGVPRHDDDPRLEALRPAVEGKMPVIVVAQRVAQIRAAMAWARESMTVVMKIDLVGPRRRGFALGLNEAAGYGGVAIAAAASGLVASTLAPRDVLVVASAIIAATALLLSLLFARDTADHVALEQSSHAKAGVAPRLPAAFADATWRRRGLRSCSHAGLVNNLNDALAWGLLPLFLAAHGVSVAQVGAVAGIYPAVWGAGQIVTGHWSDRVGRKPLIVAGMLLQAAALAMLALSDGRFAIAVVAAALLGAGTALVYPTLIAAISDGVAPVGRAPTVGVYRFWRDMGYAAGGLVAGAVADALGFGGAIAVVAGLTAASGLWVALDLRVGEDQAGEASRALPTEPMRARVPRGLA